MGEASSQMFLDGPRSGMQDGLDRDWAEVLSHGNCRCPKEASLFKILLCLQGRIRTYYHFDGTLGPCMKTGSVELVPSNVTGWSLDVTSGRWRKGSERVRTALFSLALEHREGYMLRCRSAAWLPLLLLTQLVGCEASMIQGTFLSALANTEPPRSSYSTSPLDYGYVM